MVNRCCDQYPLCIQDGISVDKVSKLCLNENTPPQKVYSGVYSVNKIEFDYSGGVFATKDIVFLREKLERLKRHKDNGVNTIILSDWDRTMTKWQKPDGTNNNSSFGVVQDNLLMTEEDRRFLKDLSNHHLAIEFDPNVSHDDKVASMNEWMESGVGCLVNSGHMTRNKIRKMAEMSDLAIRGGVMEFLRTTQKKELDVVIFSAGLKESINETLMLHGFKMEFKVVGNEFVYPDNNEYVDERDLPAIAGKKPYITPFNKFDNPALKHISISEDPSVVVCIGDSLGDLMMVSAVKNKVDTLNIGIYCKTFPSENSDDQTAFKNYLDKFDMLLMNDAEWAPVDILLSEHFY